jgi:hypothetical protein
VIDTQTVADELRQARRARIAVEAAWCEVEQLLWEMQHSPRIWRRLALADAMVPPLAA